MRMTWATQPAASKIAGIVPHAAVEPVWLSRSRWPWHLQNPHFEIWDTPKPVVKVLTWSDDTIFIKALNGCFLLLCRSSIRRRGQSNSEPFKEMTGRLIEPRAGWRFLSCFLQLWSRIFWASTFSRWQPSLRAALPSGLESSVHFRYFEESVIRGDFSHQYFMPSIRRVFCEGWWGQGRAAQRRSHSSHQQLNASGGFSTLIRWNDRLLDIFTFKDHFKQNPFPPPVPSNGSHGWIKGDLNDCFWGRIDFSHFPNYSLIRSHMINNKMHIWLRFNSFSKREDSSRPNGGGGQTNAFSKLTKKKQTNSHLLKLEITGWSPLTCMLLHQTWLIGETGAELNVFSLWSVRNPSVENCFGKH